MREMKSVKFVFLGLVISMLFLVSSVTSTNAESCKLNISDDESSQCNEILYKEDTKKSDGDSSNELSGSTITQNGSVNKCDHFGNTEISINNSLNIDSQCLCRSKSTCDIKRSDHYCESNRFCKSICPNRKCQPCTISDNTCSDNDCSESKDCELQIRTTFEKCCDFIKNCLNNLSYVLNLIHTVLFNSGMM